MEASKLYMNPGDGENSYAKNSAFQRSAMLAAKPMVDETMRQLFDTVDVPVTLGVADLGCSTGPNTLTTVSMILEAVTSANNKRQPTDIIMYLNDLPGNDFNGIFKELPDFYKGLREEKGEDVGRCFITGVPGSFHDRLFPRNSLHFVYSSSALHWCSQVSPQIVGKMCAPNKGNISLDKTSPADIFEAYYKQFKKDFTRFLASRSVEVVTGGRMAFFFLGRETREHCAKENPHSMTHYIARALMDMAKVVSKCISFFGYYGPSNLNKSIELTWVLRFAIMRGLIEEEKVDHFNIALYEPHAEELREIIEEEGSFQINMLQELKWCDDTDVTKNDGILLDRRMTAKHFRAGMESLISFEFGEDKMNELFRRTQDIIVNEVKLEEFHGVNLLVSLTKRGWRWLMVVWLCRICFKDILL